MSHQLTEVPFHGQPLFLVERNGQPYVPLKPISDGIGLQWKTQWRKIEGSERYGHMTIPLPSPGGIQDHLCIPLRKLNGWLFSINAQKVKPELQDAIIRYQEECFQALYDYWTHGTASRGGDGGFKLPGSDQDPDDTGPGAGLLGSLNPELLREYRLLNPRLAQAYLVESGITPEYINGLFQQVAGLLEPGKSGPEPAPLGFIAERVSANASGEDQWSWYFRKEAFARLCGKYDPTATARRLKQVGYLRCESGRLTYKAPSRLFAERPNVYAVLKAIADGGYENAA